MKISPRKGGLLELLSLAGPMVLSSSFATLQITIDRYFLSSLPDGNGARDASFTAMMVFWIPFSLLYSAASYVATFVAQYYGAKRYERIGSAVWQGLYFSLVAGLGMLGFTQFSQRLFAWIGHDASIQTMEVLYFDCLCITALPMLFTISASGFFSGRGFAVTVIWIDLAGTIVHTALCSIYMVGIGFLYLVFPSSFLNFFATDNEPEKWEAITRQARVLLWFVTVYCLFDGVNLVFAFALRGAGDTLFVTLVSLLLAWPMMVAPSWLSFHYGWGIYWAWGFLSLYILIQAICFYVRFLQGKWEKMRVIEPVVIVV